jgi:hypothetical protein
MNLTVDHFAPYGLLSPPFSAVVDVQPPPTDFLAAENDAARIKQKAAFLKQTIDEISSHYWPAWRQLEWYGDARKNAVAITRVDFELLISLRKKFTDNISIPDIIRPIARTHAQCFITEDSFDANTPLNNFQEFKYYVAPHASFPQDLIDVFPMLFSENLSRKVGRITMELKWQLQRPRPYQTALQLGFTNFSYLNAKTAIHPALVAGHCMQGVFGGMGVNVSWKKYTEYSAPICNALQQYSADFGDRRVLAGVHYPSDTLISWLVCFDLIAYVFSKSEQADAKKFLKAIIARSIVWNYIKSEQAVIKKTCVAYTKLIAHVEKKLT